MLCAKSHQQCLTLATPRTTACQAPLPLGFFRQAYWSGLPCLPLGYVPHPGTEPVSVTSLALAGRFFTTSTTWEAQAGNLVPSNASWLGSQGEKFVLLDYAFFFLFWFVFLLGWNLRTHTKFTYTNHKHTIQGTLSHVYTSVTQTLNNIQKILSPEKILHAPSPLIRAHTLLKATSAWIFFIFRLVLSWGTSLVIQWLRLHTFTTGGVGSIPGRGTKSPHAAKCSKERERDELCLL